MPCTASPGTWHPRQCACALPASLSGSVAHARPTPTHGPWGGSAFGAQTCLWEWYPQSWGLGGSGVGAGTALLGHPPFSMCSRLQVTSLLELADACQGRSPVPHRIHVEKPWFLSVSVCGDTVFKEVGKVK